MADKSSPHQGHRARMRQRWQNAPNSFADHELLEMLLYYTNPRKDTNETAHGLIEAFGSLEGILDADAHRLTTVFGVGENSAVLLSLLGELSRRYALQKFTGDKKDAGALDSAEKLVAFLMPRFIGATRELFYVLLLDNSLRPIDCFPVGEGSTTMVPFTVRSITERAYTKRAGAVVLAHNHPGGIAVPSKDDIQVTHRIKEALSLLEITLLEHFILSDNAYCTVLGALEPMQQPARAASPLFGQIEKTLKRSSDD